MDVIHLLTSYETDRGSCCTKVTNRAHALVLRTAHRIAIATLHMTPAHTHATHHEVSSRTHISRNTFPRLSILGFVRKLVGVDNELDERVSLCRRAYLVCA